ncbi:MAG: SMC-Scp complex subunit ScpB [Candidatus Pacebacteria bacterium]|nr:SMC-Scp complex subunit ScpB [Candidatus Paceibacterota bacterium]
MDTTNTLEALLFAAGEPLELSRIATILECSTERVSELLKELQARLTFGTRLIISDTTAALLTAPEAAPALEKLFTIEGRDIGPAGLEVLTLILYEGPLTKVHIDHVRGVNSSSTLRALMQRGLIERVRAGKENVYGPTVDLLAHLGVTAASELPDFDILTSELAQYRARTSESTSLEKSL